MTTCYGPVTDDDVLRTCDGWRRATDLWRMTTCYGPVTDDDMLQTCDGW